MDNPSQPSQVPGSAPMPAPGVPTKPAGTTPRGKHMALWAFFGVAVIAVSVGVLYMWFPNGLISLNTEAEKKPFVIGGILPLSGDGASYGVPIQQAAILAQEEINEAGGINGRQIVIEWRDGKCESADAERTAKELLDGYTLDALFAGACSSEFLAAAPLAQQRNILSVSSSATNPKISALGKYVFRTAASDALAGKVAAQYATKIGAKKAAIIAENKAYPLGLLEVFTASFKDMGGEIVASEVYETGTTDFKAAVARIKTAKPDVVYVLPQTPAPGVVIMKELKAEKVTSTYLTAEVLVIRDAVEEQGDILEGVIGIEVFFDKNNPKASLMLENYERVFGREANYPNYMAGIYDIFYLLKEAHEKTDGTTEAVAQYLYGLNNWDGTIGPITFDKNGDPTLPYQIIKISNRTTERLETITPTP